MRLLRFLPLALMVVLNAALGNAQATRSIALTFDDLPMAVVGNDQAPGKLADAQHVTTALLETLARHHAPAIGFVNEIKLNVPNERDARASLLEQWLASGMDLGNHTYSHHSLSDGELSAFEDDFVRGTTITAAQMQSAGKAEKYFRYPYLDTGKDKARKEGFISFYTARGYLNAPITVQNEDWLFNAPYVEAVAKHDSAAAKRVVDAYLEQTTTALAYAEQLSRQSFGHEIPQVMLLHADTLNAAKLEDVLQLFEQRGYRFIRLDEALRDHAYSTPDDYVGADGISWLDRWQIALGKPFHPAEPLPPKWAQEDYRRITGQAPF